MTAHGPKMECQEALAKLYEYIDGEISAVDRETVRAHLEMCRPCLDYFEFERLFNEFVKRRAPRPKARDEFKSRLLARIKVEREDSPPVAGSGHSLHRLRFAMAAVVTLLLGVGAWWVASQPVQASVDWPMLAAYHQHTESVQRVGLLTADMIEARTFVLTRMGCEMFPEARTPVGLTAHEVCVLPGDCDGIAQFEMSDGNQPVSMFVARGDCLPLTGEPRVVRGDKTYRLATINGLQALCWEDRGGYVCVMMGEADFGTMFAWAESVRQPSSF